MRASKVDFHPAMDGKASNPRSMEALTPASIEAISEDIASKYGVFLLNQSEIRVYPTKTREAEQL
ncbi:MAG TPA: hypothetical protein VG964_02880 [Candidatus Saccharimonadales bacterium]|nr:hypothetical protein [Candidatus Saccharimonadales bacterium]